MSPHNRSGRSRGDITGTVDHLKQEYDEKTGELDHTTQDVRIERETVQGMAMAGTQEALEAVVTSLKEAEDTSTREFTEQAERLEELQTEGKEFESELQERTDSTSTDLEKLDRAQSELNSKAAGSSVERANSQLQEDREFLCGEDTRERESREAAERESAQLRQIVFGAGG